MKFSVISDIHITGENKKSIDLFLTFLSSSEVSQSDRIYLLGDIFDFLMGPHEKEYRSKYESIFSALERILENKEVYYFEGNHDFHVATLFNKVFNKNKNWKNIQGSIVEPINDEKMYLSHGDEINKEDKDYFRYKKIISSEFCSFLANKVIPYRLVNFLGKKSSAASKKRGEQSFDYKETQILIRRQLKDILGEDCHYYICGHTHIHENHSFTRKTGHKSTYLNVGFPLRDNKFLFFDGKEFSFPNIF